MPWSGLVPAAGAAARTRGRERFGPAAPGGRCGRQRSPRLAGVALRESTSPTDAMGLGSCREGEPGEAAFDANVGSEWVCLLRCSIVVLLVLVTVARE